MFYVYLFKHIYACYMYRQHQEDDKEETHLILALNKCSGSQGIGVSDYFPSFSVSKLSVKLSGNVWIRYTFWINPN